MANIQNNNAPWVSVDQAPASGQAWRCTRIEHLAGFVNKGRHNIFIRVFRAGQIVRDGKVEIRWGWNGQRPDEVAKPAICDKRAPDPSTDIPIEKDQHIWIQVDDGKGTPSDKLINLHAVMDGADGNSWHHHSYDADFEISIASSPVQPPVISEPPTIPPTGLEARVAELEKQMQQVLSAIQVKDLGEAKG